MTTGEFDFNRLTQRTAAPAAALPASSAARGENPVRVISSLDEMRAAVDAVAASAQRLMSIYTPDLEPDLYDQNGFLEIVKRFVLARPFPKARRRRSQQPAGGPTVSRRVRRDLACQRSRRSLASVAALVSHGLEPRGH